MESGETSTGKQGVDSGRALPKWLGRHSAEKPSVQSKAKPGIDWGKNSKEKLGVNSGRSFPENLEWNRVKLQQRS